MGISERQQLLLRKIPGVDRILELAGRDAGFSNVPKAVLTASVRQTIESIRNTILDGDHIDIEKGVSEEQVLKQVTRRVNIAMMNNLRRTVNATGVVIHTNLGRSLLADVAMENVMRISQRYSNLEFDLDLGTRGSRYSCVEDILCEVSGAQSGLVVNNNAGAVLIALETLARGKKVIVSRGELVEIGGAFRIPDVMAKSGGILTEVGTTNRTHLKDYENAIDEDTGLLLKVHKSNYSIVGFTREVTLRELVELGQKHGVPVMEDLGSGMFIDFSRYGLTKEPTVQESVATGADVVTFSGDKLLGGPQAGLIVGKKEFVDQIKKNPINRALRIDKMTLAALESTLRLYREPEKAVNMIPTLRMLTQPLELIEQRARAFSDIIDQMGLTGLTLQLMDLPSRVGGGALPLQELPSKCVGIKISNFSANDIDRYMRRNDPPIIGRIYENWFIVDFRTVQSEEIAILSGAFEKITRTDVIMQ